MRVAAFTKYDRLAASTRQRVLQYVPSLEAAGISVNYHPLLGDSYVRILVSGERHSRAAVVGSYLQRVKQLLSVGKCDLIWVYAELFSYLPAGFEKLVFRSGTPVVYDFDDAFFHQYDDNPRPLVRAALRGKLEPLLKGAAACCCGNSYLQEYASRFCSDSILLPTVVDTDTYTPGGDSGRQGPVTIGWIGSPTTWTYLRPLLPILEELARVDGAQVRIVGAGAKAEAGRFDGMQLVEWSEESEVAEVQSMDIGIMPMPDEQWARGKSGYKLIQYMACGLPVVASPVGANLDIVEHGGSGYFAKSSDEWLAALRRLVSSRKLRSKLGQAGRARAQSDFSLQRHAPRLIDLFRSVAAKK